jgi:hypothetical protein
MDVTTYALEDQLTSVTPYKDATWLRLGAMVLRWLYGSMTLDIIDLIMPTSTVDDAPVATAYMVWVAVHGLFNDNKKTREVYLTEEFCNVKQGDLSIDDYLNRKKATADSLVEVVAPVSDSDLITNIIKGLDECFDSAADIAPLLMPFPTFLNFCNMMLMQEMKVARHTANTSTSAFVAKGPTLTPPAGGPPPPSTGGEQQWRANPHHGGYDNNKIKNKGYKPAAAPPARTPYNPWTGAIQMWPMPQMLATASSDLARVPMPTWRPPTPAVSPLRHGSVRRPAVRVNCP